MYSSRLRVYSDVMLECCDYHVCGLRNSECHVHTSGSCAGSERLQVDGLQQLHASRATSAGFVAMEVEEDGMGYSSLEVGNNHAGPSGLAQTDHTRPSGLAQGMTCTPITPSLQGWHKA